MIRKTGIVRDAAGRERAAVILPNSCPWCDSAPDGTICAACGDMIDRERMRLQDADERLRLGDIMRGERGKHQRDLRDLFSETTTDKKEDR